MPNVDPNFTASFRFDTSTTTTTRTSPQRGLTPPDGWTSGVKSSHFQWEAENPAGGATFQTTDPLQVGASRPRPGQFPANGRNFAVSVVSYNMNSVIADPIVQISAYTISGDPQNPVYNFIDPPFSSGYWRPYRDINQAVRVDIPSRAGASMVTLAAPPNLPAPFYFWDFVGTDDTGAPLYKCHLIVLPFNPNLRGLVASSDNLFIDVAIYLTLDGVRCFDDPEMEIDLGTGN